MNTATNVDENYEKLKELKQQSGLSNPQIAALTGYSKIQIDSMTMPNRKSVRARVVSDRFLTLFQFALKAHKPKKKS